MIETMKRILFFFAMIVAVSANAQEDNYSNVKPFEFEVGFGISQGEFGNNGKAGSALFLEARINIEDTPFDVGLQGCIPYYDKNNVEVNNHIYDMHIMPRSIMAYGDYNFRHWRRVSLFGGIGLGYAYVINQHWSEISNFYNDTTRSNCFAFSPRIGAEFFSHIRLTVEYKVITKSYSYFGANLGFAFGGGRKR
jgi:opacity protein-like surface antigen